MVYLLDNEIPFPSITSARGEHLVFHQAGLGPPMNLESMHAQLDVLTEFMHVFSPPPNVCSAACRYFDTLFMVYYDD